MDLGSGLGSVDLGSVLRSVLGFDLDLDLAREFGLGLVFSFDLRLKRKCLERVTRTRHDLTGLSGFPARV